VCPSDDAGFSHVTSLQTKFDVRLADRDPNGEASGTQQPSRRSFDQDLQLLLSRLTAIVCI
jgi:hypothetical protein